MRAHRLLPIAALLLFACDRDQRHELDESPDVNVERGSGDHGSTREEEVVDDPLREIERGDLDAYIRQVEDELSSMRQWASTFQRDINRGEMRATDETRAAFQQFQRDLATFEAELRNLEVAGEVPEWTERAESLYQRLELLEAQVRRIDAMRSAVQEEKHI